MLNHEIKPTTNNTWLCEGFRLTSFFQSLGRLDPSHWWESVVGDNPENRNSQPKTGAHQDEGAFEDGYLVMSVQSGRTDWLYYPAFDKLLGVPNIQALSSYNINKDSFLQVMNRWFDVSPAVKRIAFGLILDIPVPNRIAGYRELSKYIHAVKLDAENSSDFMYQINRRRMSATIPDLPLNRLSKWSTSVMERIQVPIDVSLLNTSSRRQDSQHFVHLELDINTAQEYSDGIPSDKTKLILMELAELAFEIAENGDIE